MKDEFKVATMREQAETAMACGGMFAISGQQAKRMLDRIVELESQIERITAQRLQENSMNLKVKLHLNERATNAEAELAALKGDQVPVAWTDAEELRDMEKDGCGCMLKVDHANPLTDPRRQIMLYDRPQKPVVLPSKITMGFKKLADKYECEPNQAQFIAVGWNAAIDACYEVRDLYDRPQNQIVFLPKFNDRHTCMNAGCDAAAAYKEDVIAMNHSCVCKVAE
ncbi:MAG: hypothetical protein [Bacteriophage sp.]|nr:MAG: hypothetical protein [Bacteriophage sp.]